MKPKINFKLLIVLSLILLMFTCVILGIVYVNNINDQRLAQEKIVLDGVANRTGLQPNWLAVRTYVYCDLLKPGITRDQIEKKLSLIGEFKPPNNDGNFSQQVDFLDPFLYYNLSPLMLNYDEKWHLISSGVGEFNHGPRADCEYPTQDASTK